MLAGYREVFRNRDYANLWTGQTVSVLGDSVYQVAFYWLAYKTSSSPIIAGLVIIDPALVRWQSPERQCGPAPTRGVAASAYATGSSVTSHCASGRPSARH